MLPLLLSASLGVPPIPPTLPVPGTDAVVIRRLVEALKDSDPDVRGNLAAALSRVGPAAVDPLIEALKDRNPDRRAGAAYTLGLIGYPARAALTPLLDLLDDPDVGVRRQASFALSRIMPAGRVGTGLAVGSRER